MSDLTKKIIKKGSQGARGKYASLVDIVLQGYEIPQMRTVRLDGDDYIEYFDKDRKEWLQGAKVVLPAEGEGNMSTPQKYGAAVAYARRYTTMLYYGLVSDEEIGIEDFEAIESAKTVDDVRKQIAAKVQGLSAERKKALMKKATEKAEELKSES